MKLPFSTKGYVVTFDDFVAKVGARLDAGRVAFGDRAFSEDPETLLAEVEEELLDICGWSYILLHRLRRVRAAYERMSKSGAV